MGSGLLLETPPVPKTPVSWCSYPSKVLLIQPSVGPATTEIIIYAQIHPTSTISNQLELYVARITPQPPPHSPRKRLPRPDDPTPRHPPLVLERTLKKRGWETKDVSNGDACSSRINDKKMKVGQYCVAEDRARSVATKTKNGVGKTGIGEFKVPALPKKTRMGVATNLAEEESGDGMDVQKPAELGVDRKGKKKILETVEQDLETINKLVRLVCSFFPDENSFHFFFSYGSSSKRWRLHSCQRREYPKHTRNSRSCSVSCIAVQCSLW
jgi:hypothetical protein